MFQHDLAPNLLVQVGGGSDQRPLDVQRDSADPDNS